ncbi:hypothetical protein F4677DRAFT_449282 [Hypoxylon crocopeplum]|nr:hypothetical protein F4677DRAFT_449282 [Hypoxylon crocopeplum]
MPKLIPSASYELVLAREEIEQLESQNSSTRGQSQSSRNKSVKQPTQAQPNIRKTPEAVLIHRCQYRYKDGSLFECAGNGCRDSSPWVQEWTEWKYQAEDDEDTLVDNSGDTQPDENSETPSVTSTDDKPADSLAIQSRLSEGIDDRLDCVPLRSSVVFDLLRQALCLAQKIFYYGTRKYLPMIGEGFQGPHEVRFGWAEIHSSTLTVLLGSDFIVAGQWHSSKSLVCILEYITPLRNMVCHFSEDHATHKLTDYGYTLRNVQELAILFKDKKRAFMARALRDKLVAEAEGVLAQINQMWLLAQLPLGRPFEKHYAKAFKRISGTTSWYESRGLEPPLSLLWAVRSWDLARKQPSREDWLPESLADL